VRISLEAPSGFSLPRVIASHGWFDLPPFSASAEGDAIATVVALPEGGARRLEIRQRGRFVELAVPGRSSADDLRTLVRAARRIVSLDVDLSAFHAAVARDDRFRWIAETGTGRMLRAPSMFEDVVKLVLTTNCSWAFTKKMVTALVARYGEEAPEGTRSFPTAKRLARVGESTFREVVRAGYRSPYLAVLAREVASGRTDIEGWDRDPRDAAALRKEMLKLPGVGPYVAENLLKFLGKPAGLGLDSWMRAKYARLYHGGRPITDRTIGRRCAALGPFAGLALWFDLTRDWMPDDDPTSAWAALS
jgi:3-methyladenine DNA glycosylase/8-oxoguanine DNA glycosylase